MNDEEIETQLNQLSVGCVPLDVRARILGAIEQQLCTRRVARIPWWRLSSLAALLVFAIGLNLICGAYDRALVTETFGGPRPATSVREFREDVELMAPASSTDWVEPYLQRFGEL